MSEVYLTQLLRKEIVSKRYYRMLDGDPARWFSFTMVISGLIKAIVLVININYASTNTATLHGLVIRRNYLQLRKSRSRAL